MVIGNRGKRKFTVKSVEHGELGLFARTALDSSRTQQRKDEKKRAGYRNQLKNRRDHTVLITLKAKSNCWSRPPAASAWKSVAVGKKRMP